MKNAINHLTKAAMLLVSISFLTLNGYSQEQQAKETFMKKFYAVGGVGPAINSGASASLGVQGIMKNNWSASITYQNVEMDAKNTPADYQPGMALLIILPISEAMPSVNTQFVNFTAGKYLPASRRVWFNAEAGPSIVTGEELSFTRTEVTTGGFFLIGYSESSNYSYTSTKKTTVGGAAKFDFNWAFAKWFGLGASVFGNVNSIQSTAGFEIRLTAGWMNLPKKVKHAK